MMKVIFVRNVAGYGRFQEEMKWNVLNVEMKRWFWQRFLMRNMGR